MNQHEQAYRSSIQEMLQCCRDIQLLLTEDKNIFSQQNLPSLEKSNQQKMELLTKIGALAEYIKMQHLQNIAVDATSGKEILPASSMSTEIQTLLSDLKAEIALCYKSIMTNSTIVFTNLQQLKEVWDKLLSYNASSDCLYDDKGIIK